MSSQASPPRRWSEDVDPTLAADEVRAAQLFAAARQQPTSLDAADVARIEAKLSAAIARRRIPTWAKALFGAGALAASTLAYAAVSKWRAASRSVPSTVQRTETSQPASHAVALGRDEAGAAREGDAPTEHAATDADGAGRLLSPPEARASSSPPPEPHDADSAQPVPTRPRTSQRDPKQAGKTAPTSLPDRRTEAHAEGGGLAREARLLEQAVDALRARGDAAAALVLLDTLRAEFPNGQLRLEALRVRVEALQALGRTNTALSELRRVRETMSAGSRDAAELLVLEGELHHASGDCDAALAVFTRALGANPPEAAAARARRGVKACGPRSPVDHEPIE